MLERANQLLLMSRNKLAQSQIENEIPKQNKVNLEAKKQIAKSVQKSAFNYAPVFCSKGSSDIFCFNQPDSFIDPPANLALEEKNNPQSFRKQEKENSTKICYYSNEQHIKPEQDKEITIDSVIEALDLLEFRQIFTENLATIEDLLLLTKEDMIELHTPIFARNRIMAFQKYFQTNKDIVVSKKLFYDILKTRYNPSFIEILEKTAENKESEKISIIKKNCSPEKSPNEDKSLARLAQDLQENCQGSLIQKEEPEEWIAHERKETLGQDLIIKGEVDLTTRSVKSQTPSFSTHPALKFGHGGKIQTERKEETYPNNAILQELNITNQSPDPKEEIRNFENEYCKAKPNHFDLDEGTDGQNPFFSLTNSSHQILRKATKKVYISLFFVG